MTSWFTTLTMGFALCVVSSSLAQVAALADPPPGDAVLLSRGCRTGAGIATLISPRRPHGGESLRAIVVSERPLVGARLIGMGPGKVLHNLTVVSGGGPPYVYRAVLKKPAVGRHRFALVNAKGKKLACASRRVRPAEGRRARRALRLAKSDREDVWPLRLSWNRALENLYSAWIEALFDAPAGARPSWTPLHQVLRDPTRNLLFNHLGRYEDGPGRRAVVVKPDCADLPYFLRAYFAWKLGLPMGYRHCNRGSSRRYARCTELRTNSGVVLAEDGRSVARSFSQFLRLKLSYVHSGSARTGPKDENSDLYPLALTRNALRPGAVYVDPYGHLLVVSKWVPQQGDASGLLYAVDGHPDLSVGRKRFWKGAFLFTQKIKGGGFKAFRPLILEDGQPRALSNAEIRKSRDYRRMLSVTQMRLSEAAFYARMDRVINPRPLPPLVAFKARLAALFELIQERVDSVKAGEAHMLKSGFKIVPMPRGPRIFETRGAWENFSTPARDMRLLIAIDDVVGYPRRVTQTPERFALKAGTAPEQVAKEMTALLQRFARRHAIHYVKSDGSRQRLTMADVISRVRGLEMAYNPNDCIEIRWGGVGQELHSCKRRAPVDQQALMTRFRPWFAKRDRPPIR